MNYGVGPCSLRIIRCHWDRITMVVQAGGYFGNPFKGYHRVTQGGLISHIIFNMVVDTLF